MEDLRERILSLLERDDLTELEYLQEKTELTHEVMGLITYVLSLYDLLP